MEAELQAKLLATAAALGRGGYRHARKALRMRMRRGNTRFPFFLKDGLHTLQVQRVLDDGDLCILVVVGAGQHHRIVVEQGALMLTRPTTPVGHPVAKDKRRGMSIYPTDSERVRLEAGAKAVGSTHTARFILSAALAAADNVLEAS